MGFSRSIYFGLIFLIIFSCPLVFSENTIEENFFLGLDNSKNENYEKALEYFNLVLEKENDHISTLENKGSVLLKLERYEEALSIFNYILTKNPENIDALNNKAVALIGLKKYEEASKIFEHVLGKNSKYTAAIENMKIIFDILGRIPIEETKYDAYVQIELRNKNNQLIGFFETNRISVLPHYYVDEYLEKQNSEVIEISGNKYQIFKISKSVTALRDEFIGNTVLQSEYTNLHVTLFSSLHHGYVLEKNDTVKASWVIFRSLK